MFIGTFIVLFLIFYFITEGELIPSLLLSLGSSFVIVALYTYILKQKLESVLGKIYYVTTLISENQENVENALVPVTIYEELEDILKIIEETIVNLRDTYQNKVKELELSYEPILEKSSELIRYIERLREGYLNADEIPEGIDPVGAMGAALKESLEEMKTHIENMKVLLEELHADFRDIEYRITELAQDKHLEQKLKALESIINKLEKEISFFK